MSITKLKNQIFEVDAERFEEKALEVFQYQYRTIPVYKAYLDAISKQVDEVKSLYEIPFLPIQFFKTHQVISEDMKGNYNDLICFESSGTTGQVNSKHFVGDIALYEKSFTKGFQYFFGEVRDYCILGLLPSYLERGNSSLVYMVNSLIEKSEHPSSGFYLHNIDELQNILQELELKQQPTILIGVTYALLDLAESFSMKLNYVKIIETGGMKGRRVELLRDEVHDKLKQAFGLEQIYSEYGMTELLSQAYSLHDGIFKTPSWMRVLTRDANDPFQLSNEGKGVLNIIDLANLNSCSFIATDDVGELFQDGSFTVKGRLDQADIRGCSLMLV